ncbi:MAG: hypothetical protein RLZ40_1028, partial [Actinomycetota bacterium]
APAATSAPKRRMLVFFMFLPLGVGRYLTAPIGYGEATVQTLPW